MPTTDGPGYHFLRETISRMRERSVANFFFSTVGDCIYCMDGCFPKSVREYNVRGNAHVLEGVVASSLGLDEQELTFSTGGRSRETNKHRSCYQPVVDPRLRAELNPAAMPSMTPARQRF